MGNTSRSKNSILNAVTAIALTIVNGVLGLVATRMIIGYYGSDFNGLNSTANQLVNILLMMEGGFTLASNVALFAPITNGDYEKANRILSITRKKFRLIGLLFILIGIAIAALYTFIVNSDLSRWLIFSVIIFTVLPAALNLFLTSVYRVVLQAQQKEYIINSITMMTLGLGHVGNIVLILLRGPIWAVRLITMLFALANCLFIVIYVRFKCKFIDLKVGPCGEKLKGTGDVMAQKITGVIYNSAPIIFLSVSSIGGTLLASVYAVYNNVYNLIKNLLRGLIDAPRLSLGQMLTTEKNEDIWRVFKQYEFITGFAIFVMIVTAYVLILPFISLYAGDISDVQYYDKPIAFFMTLIALFELIHIPSGHLMNMAGKFREGRNYQIIACGVLCLLMIIGVIFWGVYGLLAAVLAVAVLLAVLEIVFIHNKYFKKKLLQAVRIFLPFCVLGAGVAFAESLIITDAMTIGLFILHGFILVAINSILAIIISLLFCRQELFAICKRIKTLLLHNKK